MTRILLAAIAFLAFGSTTLAADDLYSAHCMDTTQQKITLFFDPASADEVLAAFAQDEEGWPYAVKFTRATPEQIGSLTLPENHDMFMGAAPDDAGMGLTRYLLLPTKMDPFKFTAFHGGHYSDEPIVLEEKMTMECF